MIALRIWTALTVALVACAVVPPPDAPLADVGDACEAACAHRAELGCLEPRLAPMCLQTCILAAQRGLYSPACVVQAKTREVMAACPRVRCDP
jgi:hypothetical protein